MDDKVRYFGQLSARDRLSLLCVALAAALYLAFAGTHLYRTGGLFWDARVYWRAVQDCRAEVNPYRHLAQLNFVYPPVVLKAWVLLSRWVPFHVLAVLWGVLDGAATFALPLILWRGYLRGSWMTAVLAMGLFFLQPMLMAETAFLSGNVSTVLYAAVLGFGAFGLHRGRWSLFYVTVLLAATVKLPFLTFLLFPLLLGSRQELASAVVTGLAGISLLLQRLAWPTLYRAYRDAVSFQVLELRDAGLGLPRYVWHVAGVAPRVSSPAVVGYGLHLLVFAPMLWLLWRRKGSHEPVPVWVWNAAVVLAAVLASPRVLEYDLDVAVLPATVLVVYSFKSLWQRGADARVFILPTAAFTVLLARSGQAAMFCFCLSALALFLFASSSGPMRLRRRDENRSLALH